MCGYLSCPLTQLYRNVSQYTNTRHVCAKMYLLTGTLGDL